MQSRAVRVLSTKHKFIFHIYSQAGFIASHLCLHVQTLLQFDQLVLAGSQGRKGSSNVMLKSRRKAKIPKGSVEGAELNGMSCG